MEETPMYAVSFIHSATQVETISRFFTTKKAAVKWFDWVKDQSYVAAAKLYRGEAGAELVQEVTNTWESSI
jgi:hypothetical protein